MKNSLPARCARFLLLSLLPLFAASPAGAQDMQADRVLVIKSEQRLLLFNNGEVLKIYRVSLGKKQGAKACLGDHKTPEGHYIIDRRNPASRFYKSLHISYPNADDINKAKSSGRLPGKDVMIHGLPRGYEDLGRLSTRVNWTNGCIAVSNEEMDEIWRLVPDGTPIDIVP